MNAPRCEHCPADLGDVCCRWTTGHARFCELAANRPDYRRLIAMQSRRSGEGPAPAGAAPVDPAESALSLKIDLCRYRLTCQCRPPYQCGRGSEPVAVDRETCRACDVEQVCSGHR